jgi:hypothetical protein
MQTRDVKRKKKIDDVAQLARKKIANQSSPGLAIKPICPSGQTALQWRMPALTRKRGNDRPETWHVHYAGVIVERSGAPPSSDQWQWCCGFYPGQPSGRRSTWNRG